MNFRPAKSVAGLIVRAAASGLLVSLILGPASGAELQFFQFRTSYKGVKADPEKIWQADDLVSSSRPVEIHEYTLAVGKDVLLVSQIWNDNCSIEVCPTRLVRPSACSALRVARMRLSGRNAANTRPVAVPDTE